MKYYSESGLEIFYGTEHSAGLDLPFYDKNEIRVIINPGQRAKLPTGVHVEIPAGYYGKVDSRSSTSKLGLVLMCSTIDADYRGNIHLVFTNVSNEPVVLDRGVYLAQLIILPYLKVQPVKIDNLSDLSNTERGNKGFGSTTNK